MAQSVKVNYILNLINTGTQMLFPLITFPYVCRVIEADGIGQINFFQSIISYISLFTCLGIPMYAIREIARDRSDVVQMNRTAMEILLLHSMLTSLLAFHQVELREIPNSSRCEKRFESECRAKNEDTSQKHQARTSSSYRMGN
mgnify:CR=1 FL=1